MARRTDEESVPITGGDPASTHHFTDDGSIVVYRNLAGRAHRVTPVLTMRDTTSGGLAWETEFESTIVTVSILDERVVVTLGNPFEEYPKEYWVNKYVILDLHTGEELQRGETGFKIRGLG